MKDQKRSIEKKILQPREGHKTNLVLNVAGIVLGIALIIGIVYSKLSGGGEITLNRDDIYILIAVGTAIVFLYFRFRTVGSYVVISEEGISRPFYFKNQDPEFINLDDIRSYEVITLENVERVKGVRLHTDNGKIVYSEDATPGVSEEIEDHLDRYGIEEKEKR